MVKLIDKAILLSRLNASTTEQFVPIVRLRSTLLDEFDTIVLQYLLELHDGDIAKVAKSVGSTEKEVYVVISKNYNQALKDLKESMR